jgi:hypothetical protein
MERSAVASRGAAPLQEADDEKRANLIRLGRGGQENCHE